MIRAILCDNDGCLVPETNEPFDDRPLARIAELNADAARTGAGPVLTVCSGRPQPFVEAMCRLVGNLALPAICENGVWVWDPTDNAYLLDPRISAGHIETIRAAETWAREMLGPRGVAIQPGKTAMLSLFHPEPEALREIAAEAEEAFRERGWDLRVSMTVTYINCDLPFVSKASGIERFTERTGLGREELAGVGDTPSDLAIRERVRWFACPANADDELKAAADYVSPHKEARGVLEIVERLRDGAAG